MSTIHFLSSVVLVENFERGGTDWNQHVPIRTNRVHQNQLIDKKIVVLFTYGIKGTSLQIIESYLTDRRVVRKWY